MERAATAESTCRLRQVTNAWRVARAASQLRQVTSDNFEWTRMSGRTVSGRLSERRVNAYRYPVTGPDTAIQGRYYLYITPVLPVVHLYYQYTCTTCTPVLPVYWHYLYTCTTCTLSQCLPLPGHRA